MGPDGNGGGQRALNEQMACINVSFMSNVFNKIEDDLGTQFWPMS